MSSSVKHVISYVLNGNSTYRLVHLLITSVSNIIIKYRVNVIKMHTIKKHSYFLIFGNTTVTE